MENKNKLLPLFETLFIIVAEIVVSAIVCAVFLIINKFSYRVITGAALGSAVTIANFIVLSILTGRAINKALLDRGDKEMTDEEAEQFARTHQAELVNAQKLSYIIRTGALFVALILAFTLDAFDVWATAVPLLMFRPIVTLLVIIQNKKKKG